MSKIREAVQAKVEQKVAAGEALEAAVLLEREARERLHEAESASQSARAVARREGWTERELRSLGLIGTTRRRRSVKAASGDSEVQRDHVE